ncbi:unnamed protein product [Prorocentrum cordatum]|uniref:Anaphase-promoting complex subunit 1 n=1 Tax=Prorocentrum cordatum TaxID=2364126 RepID=A0ABN9TA23_9DINO|nr:unnamed protein product [Polarella glacialis]
MRFLLYRTLAERIVILVSSGDMYHNFRPAPLNMSVVPGLHLSTSGSRCLFPPKPDDDTAAFSQNQGKHQCDLGNCTTSADGESLAPGESELSEVSEDVACVRIEPTSQIYSEPSSPFDSMLLKRKRQRALLQEASHEKAEEPGVMKACDFDGSNYCELSSPLGSMLVKAKRQNAFNHAFLWL